ncbi:MAG: GNAT family N-acetyltransferase [Aggregatilineales bacterium]
MGYPTTVRPAQSADIPHLAEYWYDNMVLLQQSQPQVRLLPDAIQHWSDAAGDWLTDETVYFLVSETDTGQLTGGIIAFQQDNTPGLSPARIAVLQDMVLDMHTKQTRGGLGRILLTALQDALKADGITQLQVTVAARVAVQQAFWRSSSATHIYDSFWMTLTE